MKMLVAKPGVLGIFCGLVAVSLAQAPSDKLSGGFEIVYTTKADLPDPEKPTDVEHVQFQITHRTKGGVTMTSSKNLTRPGLNERVVVGTKDECLYNVDPLSWTEKGHFVRFERTKGPMNDDFFEPTYRLYKQDTSKLLADHPPVNGKSSFELGGDKYELEVDPETKLVSKATIKFATGQVFEKTASDFQKFGEVYIAKKVVSKENYDPVVETKTFTLDSAKPISTLSLPFSKDSLPPGSKVSDKIDYVTYEVDEKGKWQKTGTIQKPDTAQKVPPDVASKAVVFVCIVSAAFCAFGTKIYIQARK